MIQTMWKGRCLPQDNTVRRERYKPHELARLDILDRKRRRQFFLIEERFKSN